MGVENWEKISMHWSGSYEQVELYVVRPDPRLSYFPINPRFDQQEAGYSFWDYYHVIPGKETEMNDLLLKWSKLLEEKNVTSPFIITTGDRGTEMPVYIIQTYGKDVVDFWSYSKDMWGLLGADGGALYKKMISLLRKRSVREFQFRPDLSY